MLMENYMPLASIKLVKKGLPKGEVMKKSKFLLLILIFLTFSGIMFSIPPSHSYGSTPILVTSDINASGLAQTYQNHGFTFNGRTWEFYVNGSSYWVFKSTTDNSIFSSETKVRPNSQDPGGDSGGGLSIGFNGTHMVYVYSDVGYNSVSLWYCLGTPNNTTGAISFGSEHAVTSVGGSDYFAYSTICLDSNGYPWICYDVNLATLNVTKSSTRDGTWTTDSGYPLTLANGKAGCIVPLTAGKMGVVYTRTGEIYVETWNGTVWSGGIIYTYAGNYVEIPYSVDSFSAVSSGDFVHFVDVSSSGGVDYFNYSEATGQSYAPGGTGPIEVGSSDGFNFPVISLIPSQNVGLAVLWYDNVGKIRSAFGNNGTFNSAVDWITTGVHVSGQDELSVSPSDYGTNEIHVMWNNYTSSYGYNLMYAALSIFPVPTIGQFEAPASSTIITPYEVFNSGAYGDEDHMPYVFGTQWIAQTFTVGSVGHNITSVKLKLFREGNPGDFTVGIRATDGNGHSTGADLTNGTTNANVFSSDLSGNWYEITITSHALVANTKYAIACRALAGDQETGNYVAWKCYNSGGYAGGNGEISTNNGSSWTAGTPDAEFEIWANVTTTTVAVYANKLFYINATVSSLNGNTSFVNATLQITGPVTLLWVNSTNTFSVSSDSNGYCTLDSGLREYVNSTSYHLCWKIELNWTYPEGSINVLSAQVYDNYGSGTNAQSNVFGFTNDLSVMATASDSRVDPSQSLTFTGQLHYYGTSTIPDTMTGTSARVELAGVLKGSNTTINSTGYFTITFNAESSVGNYSYNVYSWTSEVSVANESLSVKVDRFKIVSIISDDVQNRTNVNANVVVNVTIQYENDQAIVTTGTFTLNGSSLTYSSGVWQATFTNASVAARTYDVVAGSGDIYALTTVNMNTQSITITWDNLVISSKGVTDPRTNINAYEQYYFTLRSEYDDAAVQSGSVTLNGTLPASWIPSRSRWEYNMTKSSPQLQALYVASANWDTYGITSLSDQSSNSTSIVWDKARIYYEVLNVSRTNITTAIEFRVKGLLLYDNTALGSGDSVTANFGALSWDATDGWFNASKTVGTSSSYVFTISSLTQAAYGITTFEVNVTDPTGVWDNLVVSSKGVTGNHVNVNVYEQYYFTLRSEYDGTSVQSGTVVLNGSLSASWISSRSRWEYNTTKSSAQAQALYVDSINWDVYNITSLSSQVANYTSIIWDKVNVTTFTVTNNRIGVGSSASFSVGGVYEYNLATWSGTASLNDSVTKSSVGRYGYRVLSITDSNYGLTVFEQSALDLYVIFDKVNVTLSISNNWVNLGTSASVTNMSTYEYDGASYDGTIVLNDTLLKSVVGKYGYTVTSVSGGSYSLTVFDTNALYCIFDKITLTLSLTPNRINVGATANITASGVHQYDGSGLNGTGTFNDTTTKAVVGTYSFTTQSLTDTDHGITVFQSNVVSCTWDNWHVTSKGVTSLWANLHQYDQYWVKLQSEADGIPLSSGTVYFNGSLQATYDTVLQRWAYNTTSSTPLNQTLYVMSITYGAVTSLSDQSTNGTWIRWDCLDFMISATDVHPSLNTTVILTATAIYELDGQTVSSWVLNINRKLNSGAPLHYATASTTTPTWNDSQDLGTYCEYLIENASDLTNGLTSWFLQNSSVVITWANPNQWTLSLTPKDLNGDLPRQINVTVTYNGTTYFSLITDVNPTAVFINITDGTSVDISATWYGHNVNATWTYNMTSDYSVFLICNIWSFTLTARDNSSIPLGTSASFDVTLPNGTMTNVLGTFGSGSFKVTNGTYYAMVYFQGQPVSSNTTLTMVDSTNSSLLIDHCTVYNLIVLVQTSSNSPSPNTPIVGAIITLVRTSDATTLNGLYDIPSYPLTTSYNSSYAIYTFPQLAGQNYTVIAKISSYSQTNSITLNSDMTDPIAIYYPSATPPNQYLPGVVIVNPSPPTNFTTSNPNVVVGVQEPYFWFWIMTIAALIILGAIVIVGKTRHK